MFNIANFDLLWKFWVSCQFLKAIQNNSLFLNNNFKDSDIRKSISYVKLDDHMTPTQSNKNRRLSNIEKYIEVLVFSFLIPSEIIWVPIRQNRFHILCFISKAVFSILLCKVDIKCYKLEW